MHYSILLPKFVNVKMNLSYRPFAFDEECLNKPSEIEIVYHINDSRYLYSIKWDKYAIYEEILDELRTKTNINLFHRWYDKVSDIVKVDFTDKIQVSDNENYIISSSLLKIIQYLVLLLKRIFLMRC